MLATGLVAIDSTILATAVPSVVGDIGGFPQFPWLFSIYLLAQAVSVPIYSKLADTIGRKPMILIGVGLFLLGSVLCGVAWSMPALIAFRAVQGLGAGAVLPISITIMGDIYSLEERAKAQGYIASVWAVASVLGPTLGGVFSQLDAWRFIFFVNVPLCLVATWMLARRFHERIERTRHRIDYAGALLLTVSLSLLILGVLEGGQAWAWDSAPSIAAFAIGGALLLAFLLVERRAREPIVPLGIFSRRLISTTTLISLGIGAILIGLTSYVPTYLEGTLHVEPLVSGLALAALTIGWPLAASQAGRLYLRLGFRTTVLIGVAFAVIGSAVLVAIALTPNLVLVAIGCFVVGVGLGLVAVPSLVAAQSSVDWSERGVVTGTNMFARSMGSSLGAAVFGAIANGVFAGTAGGEHDPVVLEHASLAVFVSVAVCAVATVLAVLAMPRDRRRGAPVVAGATAAEG